MYYLKYEWVIKLTVGELCFNTTNVYRNRNSKLSEMTKVHVTTVGKVLRPNESGVCRKILIGSEKSLIHSKTAIAFIHEWNWHIQAKPIFFFPFLVIQFVEENHFDVLLKVLRMPVQV